MQDTDRYVDEQDQTENEHAAVSSCPPLCVLRRGPGRPDSDRSRAEVSIQPRRRVIVQACRRKGVNSRRSSGPVHRGWLRTGGGAVEGDDAAAEVAPSDLGEAGLLEPGGEASL